MTLHKDYDYILRDSINNGKITVLSGLKGCGKRTILGRFLNKYKKRMGLCVININLRLSKFSRLKSSDDFITYMENCPQYCGQECILSIIEVNRIKDLGKLFYMLSQYRNIKVFATSCLDLEAIIDYQFLNRNIEIIDVYPLTYKECLEYYQSKGIDTYSIEQYMLYGGLPDCLSETDNSLKKEYLSKLVKEEIIDPLLMEHTIYNEECFLNMAYILPKIIGKELTPYEFSKDFSTGISDKTTKMYLNYLRAYYLINPALKYNIKDKKYKKTSAVYYMGDNGFMHIQNGSVITIEGIKQAIFTHLKSRGFKVCSGFYWGYEKSEDFGKPVRAKSDIDFVASKDGMICYINVCEVSKEDIEKSEKSFLGVKDGFNKIIVINKNSFCGWTENGIRILGIYDFFDSELMY